MTVHITVNGEPFSFEHEPRLNELVDKLSLDMTKIAVERNLEIIPRSAYDSTKFCEGDRVEIVQFIGGG